MRLTVFGASGQTGREVVRQALARGFNVTAYVRERSVFTMAHGNLRVIRGDITDGRAIGRVLEDQTGVVSTLGVGKPLTHDAAVIEGVRTIVRAAEQGSVNRFLYMSFIGVGNSLDDAGFVLKRLATTLLRHEVSDHQVKEAAIVNSFVDWTIVRPPKLTNGRLTAAYRVGEDIRAKSPFPVMSRADVADFIIRQFGDTTYIRKIVRILH